MKRILISGTPNNISIVVEDNKGNMSITQDFFQSSVSEQRIVSERPDALNHFLKEAKASHMQFLEDAEIPNIWEELEQQLDDTVNEVLVEGDDIFQQVLDYVKIHAPQHIRLIERYDGNTPLINNDIHNFSSRHKNQTGFSISNSIIEGDVQQVNQDEEQVYLRPSRQSHQSNKQRQSPIQTNARRGSNLFWLLLVLTTVGALLYFGLQAN